MKKSVQLSVVIPLFNEEKILFELIQRCQKTLARTQLAYELILVDDASTDNSYEILKKNSSKQPGKNNIQILRLTQNSGQFQATIAGIQIASADKIVCLDGDLQDPPELIYDMLELISKNNLDLNHEILFAIKKKLYGGLIFRVGNSFYRMLLFFFNRNFPYGGGSYCLFHKKNTNAFDQFRQRHGNIAAVLSSQGLKHLTINYEKQPRYDKKSRIGYWGLFREALATFRILRQMKKK